MKVFISQSTNNKTPQMIIKEREDVIKIIKQQRPKEVIEIINPYVEDFINSNIKNPSLTNIGENIKALDEVDMVVFINDWSNSESCNIEYRCAEQHHIAIQEIHIESEELDTESSLNIENIAVDYNENNVTTEIIEPIESEEMVIK